MQNPTYGDSADQTGIRIPSAPSSTEPSHIVPRRPLPASTSSNNSGGPSYPGHAEDDSNYDVPPPSYAAVVLGGQPRSSPGVVTDDHTEAEKDGNCEYSSISVSGGQAPLNITVLPTGEQDTSVSRRDIPGSPPSGEDSTYGRLHNPVVSATSDSIYNHLTR